MKNEDNDGRLQPPPFPRGSGPKRPPSSPPTSRPPWLIIWYVLLGLFVVWAWQSAFSGMSVETIAYSEFKHHLTAGEVVEAKLSTDEVTGRIVPHAEQAKRANAPGESPAQPAPDDRNDNASRPAAGPANARPDAEKGFLFRAVRVEDPDLVKQLEQAGVTYSGQRPSIFTQMLVAWILPIGVMVALWMFISRRISRAGESALRIGKSRARLHADRKIQTTFADVAGCDEAKFELQEVVDFLKHPKNYVQLGARIPKGVLLAGPPGTGKTLLARAAAGEARVPFYSISGSDFVEMFVGVGASRVRDLFAQGKRNAPCIIFIDELDAIGRQRGVHMGAVNDEREQTLNALLVELDGFEANTGVIILAATNRPEVLDHALLRPGRFDRQIVVDAPDRDGREAILRVHARGKRLGDDVDLRRIAGATVGFPGADLANLLNEAALLAARRHAREIAQGDLEEAIDKVVAGPERKSRRLNEEEKRRVAYHEVGHALVAAYTPRTAAVHKISIVPRGRAALGFTMQRPAEDQFLLTTSELEGRLRGMLGGRSAEEVVFHEVSTGAQNDLERATAIARHMVTLYGMSGRVGLGSCAQRLPAFPGAAHEQQLQRDCSEQTAREIDEEVRRLLAEAYDEARDILETHRDQLETVAQELLERESIDGTRFYELIGREMPHANESLPRPAGVGAPEPSLR